MAGAIVTTATGDVDRTNGTFADFEQRSAELASHLVARARRARWPEDPEDLRAHDLDAYNDSLWADYLADEAEQLLAYLRGPADDGCPPF